MSYNGNLHNQLPVISQENPILKAYLINIDDQAEIWEFLVNPQVINYSADSSYSTNFALFGKQPNTRFQSANVGKISISDLTMTTPGHIRSLRPIMISLEALRLPKADQISPPKLSFVYGQRVIQPLFLQSVSFQESEHLNGEPTLITVSLSFIGADQIQF